MPGLFHVYLEGSPIVFNNIYSQESMECCLSAPLQMAVPNARSKDDGAQLFCDPPEMNLQPPKGVPTTNIE